jgi:hypothetical protein
MFNMEYVENSLDAILPFDTPSKTTIGRKSVPTTIDMVHANVRNEVTFLT